MPRKISPVKAENRYLFLLALAVAIPGLSGCLSKEFTYTTTVAGGEELKFTLGQGGPTHARAGGFEVLDAALSTDFPGKKIFYKFSFSDSARGRGLQTIGVEDVTDATAVLLHEDAQPKLVDRTWEWKSPPLALDDPSLKWLSFVSDSMRVYRFTLTFDDGHKVVLNQLTMMPGWVKTRIREMFGEKY
jgi:hypothetical protein